MAFCRRYKILREISSNWSIVFRQLLFVFLLGVACKTFAAENTQTIITAEKEEMQKEYYDQNVLASNIFSGIPFGHVKPERDTVVLGVALDFKRVSIVPSENYARNKDDKSVYLNITGASGSPLIAFSNDGFGMGFAGEFGKFNTYFKKQESGGSRYSAENGDLTFSGLGIFGYCLPKFQFLPRSITVNVVGGFKQLYASHETSTDNNGVSNSKNPNKYRYSIKKIEIGTDIGIELAKNFTFIPWINYSIIGMGQMTDGSGNLLNNNTLNDKVLAGDMELFWTSKPPLSYGIDFTASIMRTELHLGGLLGIIAGLAKGSDNISNKSITLSLSYKVK